MNITGTVKRGKLYRLLEGRHLYKYPIVDPRDPSNYLIKRKQVIMVIGFEYSRILQVVHNEMIGFIWLPTNKPILSLLEEFKPEDTDS